MLKVTVTELKYLFRQKLRHFFCCHKWVSERKIQFKTPKMDSNGVKSTHHILASCDKCGKHGSYCERTIKIHSKKV